MAKRRGRKRFISATFDAWFMRYAKQTNRWVDPYAARGAPIWYTNYAAENRKFGERQR